MCRLVGALAALCTRPRGSMECQTCCASCTKSSTVLLIRFGQSIFRPSTESCFHSSRPGDSALSINRFASALTSQQFLDQTKREDCTKKKTTGLLLFVSVLPFPLHPSPYPSFVVLSSAHASSGNRLIAFFFVSLCNIFF